MYKFIAFFGVFVLGVFSVSSAEVLLKVTADETPLFIERTGEPSKGDLLSGEKMVLEKKGGERSYVKTLGGLRGWVRNSDVQKVRLVAPDTYELGEIEIKGWLDNPHSIYIFQHQHAEIVALAVTRNFKRELMEFVDREKLERNNLEDLSYPIPGFYNPVKGKTL